MRRFALAVALVLLGSVAHAAGSVVVTSEGVGSGIVRYAVAWTSDASGDVSGQTYNFKRGSLVQFKFVPGSGGTQPTDLYDATFVDASGFDLLAAAGANLSNATGKTVKPAAPFYFDGLTTIALVIANAGNAKTGTFYLYIGP